jgi:hypothetical protein
VVPIRSAAVPATTASPFLGIDGGGGTDTLALSGAGQLSDFTALADGRIMGIPAAVKRGSAVSDMGRQSGRLRGRQLRPLSAHAVSGMRVAIVAADLDVLTPPW